MKQPSNNPWASSVQRLLASRSQWEHAGRLPTKFTLSSAKPHNKHLIANKEERYDALCNACRSSLICGPRVYLLLFVSFCCCEIPLDDFLWQDWSKSCYAAANGALICTQMAAERGLTRMYIHGCCINYAVTSQEFHQLLKPHVTPQTDAILKEVTLIWRSADAVSLPFIESWS